MINFLDLPFELRLQIYQYIFTDNDSDGASRLFLRLSLGNTSLSEAPRHRGITAVSKQCYAETTVLHTNSLTHLVVECERFGLFKPVSSKWDSTRHYEWMFRRSLQRVAHEPGERHLRLLWRLKKLTVPSFISVHEIRDVYRSVLPLLRTISFISTDGPIHDLYPTQPLHSSGAEHHTIRSGFFYGRPGIFVTYQEKMTRRFVPLWHLERVVCRERWEGMQELSSKDGLRVLWTTRVRWKRERVKLKGDPEVVYRSPGVGPFCYMVEYMYTFDCFNQELKDFQILSRTKCATEGCPNRLDEAAFWEYLSPQAREMSKN